MDGGSLKFTPHEQWDRAAPRAVPQVLSPLIHNLFTVDKAVSLL